MLEDHPKIQPQQRLDWQWIERYRQLVSYDLFWWWAQAGPFTVAEQMQWKQLIAQELDETRKELLNNILIQSRNREIVTALLEQREPHLQYPVLVHSLEGIRARIHALKQLDQEIQRDEPHSVVRHLYHDTLNENIDFLHLIETTSTGDSSKYTEITRLVYPLPTLAEMQYPLEQVKKIALKSLRYVETAHISQLFIQHIRAYFQMPEFITDEEIIREQKHQAPLPDPEINRTVSAQTAKRFFERVLQEAGYTSWCIEIDPKAGGASVQPSLRQLQLSNEPLTLKHIRHLLAHEIAGHVARSVAGEQSPLGILAIGTAGYLATEEGFALYNERQVAILHQEHFDDSSIWIHMLAVGLACGVVTPPQTFTSLLKFFELLITQHRLLYQFDSDLETAKKQAKKRAISRCLRTFRGVPDLAQPGVAYTKDVVYLRGLRSIEQAAAQDKTVLNRLAVGKIALERLKDIAELQIIAPPQRLRERAFDTDLDQYIVSFEQ